MATDVLIDPFRPGVLERLGLDPEKVLLKVNPRLIVVRLTGFRRDGKYKDMAGHDIDYLAVSGVLSMLGGKDKPPSPPGNMLGDFAGGGLVAFVGTLLALSHRAISGEGQVVHANMVDGASFLASCPRLLLKTPFWNGPRGTNQLDGGAPYYGCYECKDRGKYMAVGALEPQFFRLLLNGLGLTMGDVVPGKGIDRTDKRTWPYMRLVFEERFKSRTRAEWEAIFEGTDACTVPVLENEELELSGYELRPMVGLTKCPSRPIDGEWAGKELIPGEEGDEILRQWMGWERGKDFVTNQLGALQLRQGSKL